MDLDELPCSDLTLEVTGDSFLIQQPFVVPSLLCLGCLVRLSAFMARVAHMMCLCNTLACGCMSHLCPICLGYWSVIAPSCLAWLSTSSCRASCFYCSAGRWFNPGTCQDGICHVCAEQGKTCPNVCKKWQ